MGCRITRITAVCLVLALGAHRGSAGADRPSGPSSALPLSSEASLGLSDLEQMALQGNPTLAQAAAQVDAARGRTMQAGLYPNPTIGYDGEQIGARGTAGERQGMFVDQVIVTAGKLRLSRAKFAQEITQAEWQAVAQQYRVVNGVRMRFYELLARQRLIDVQADLLKVAEEAVKTTEQLINVGAANRPDFLQARIEARQQRVTLENARTRYLAAWQELAALIGQPCLSPVRLQGNLEEYCAVPDWNTTLAHLMDASPEIQYARSGVVRNQFTLRREQVEPIPNVNVRVANGYNFETQNNTTDASIGFRLPLFDKNQGNIRAAQAEVARAQAEVSRVELSLQQRLARAYAHYRTALAAVENYRKYNLPEAREAFELYLDSFRKRRAAYPQVLMAQRNYYQISVDYVEALVQVRRAEVAICGLLLVDGLEEPPGPSSEGGRPQRGGWENERGEPLGGRDARRLTDRIGTGSMND